MLVLQILYARKILEGQNIHVKTQDILFPYPPSYSEEGSSEEHEVLLVVV
jgi:hypothetical protein